MPRFVLSLLAPLLLTLPSAALAETCESGFYPGQDGDPSEVFERLSAEHDVLFTIDSTGQFDTRWSAWIRDPA